MSESGIDNNTVHVATAMVGVNIYKYIYTPGFQHENGELEFPSNFFFFTFKVSYNCMCQFGY